MAQDALIPFLAACVGGLVTYHATHFREQLQMKKEAYFNFLECLIDGSHFIKNELTADEIDMLREWINRMELAVLKIDCCRNGAINRKILDIFANVTPPITSVGIAADRDIIMYKQLSSAGWTRGDIYRAEPYLNIIYDYNIYDRFYNDISSLVNQDLSRPWPWWHFWK